MAVFFRDQEDLFLGSIRTFCDEDRRCLQWHFLNDGEGLYAGYIPCRAQRASDWRCGRKVRWYRWHPCFSACWAARQESRDLVSPWCAPDSEGGGDGWWDSPAPTLAKAGVFVSALLCFGERLRCSVRGGCNWLRAWTCGDAGPVLSCNPQLGFLYTTFCATLCIKESKLFKLDH